MGKRVDKNSIPSNEELEKLLNSPKSPEMVPYPPKKINLKNGKTLVIRECDFSDINQLLEAVKPLMFVPDDWYDIVACRVYSEILGWYRQRITDCFVLVGTVDGEIAGIVTSRHKDKDTGMSLHTLAIKRGCRAGANMLAAKMEHHLDYLGEKEVLIVAESINGFRRWMGEYGLMDKTDEYNNGKGLVHELGGSPTFSLTKEIWEEKKADLCKNDGTPTAEELAATRPLKIPREYPQILGFARN